MQRISQHNILLGGESFAHCSDQVHKFFDLTSLVIYDCIEIQEDKSFSGLDADFFQQIDLAQQKNEQRIKRLVDELYDSGVEKTQDLVNIEQGYVSKTLHLLSHFLDGFIGIDSIFYNLLDDSHRLVADTRRLIIQNPGHYWLLHVDGYTTTPEEASLLHS
ncbi:hypothetical protein [Desulforhopalus sp. 52FAK]